MLGIVVFGCGAAVMVLELVGARILAPFCGTSLTVWSGLIGLILASLSLGYWLGGKLADRKPEGRVLSGIIALAAVLVAATATTKIPLLTYLASREAGPKFVALAATALLYAPAAALLGMVSPFAVRLSVRDAATSGATAGRLYALSTLGSIVGTLAAGFYLIAALGTTAILLAVAGFLLLLSIAAWWGGLRSKLAVAAVIALCGLGVWANDLSLAAAGVEDVDTAYGRLLVYQGFDPHAGRTIRLMTTGPARCQSAVYPDAPDVLVLPYTRFFALALSLAQEPKRILVLGGGGYSFPRHVLATLPRAEVTVVELDPGVTRIARKHFGLVDDPRLTIVHEDARTFVNRPGSPYDLIFVDVFGTDYLPPFHLVTREAAERLGALLAPGGAVVVNAIGAPDGPGGRFLRSLAATFADVFADTAVYPLGGADRAGQEQNVMLTARREPGPGPTAADDEGRGFLAGRLADPTGTDALVLTDDHAPVEWLGLGL